MKPLVVRAPFNIRSGYETLSETICVELSKNGYKVFPISSNGEITNTVIKSLVKPLTKEILSNVELCILPIHTDVNDYNRFIRMPRSDNRVIFTMWESTQLSMDVVDTLNTSKCVIVPNEWNKENFVNDGVTVPILKCPLFVDTNIFKYKRQYDGDFTFGTGNGDLRKRLNDVLKCFCKAFSPSTKDVKFSVKINPQELRELTKFSDDRILINVNKLSKQELASWYHSINIFVSGTSSEGWGLMQHEAMACGRPLIACQYSGLKEFFDKSVGLPLSYEEVPSEWSWSYTNGLWSKFNEDDMIDRMRWSYNHPDEIIKLGKLSSKKAKKFNLKNFVNKLTKILDITVFKI